MIKQIMFLLICLGLVSLEFITERRSQANSNSIYVNVGEQPSEDSQ